MRGDGRVLRGLADGLRPLLAACRDETEDRGGPNAEVLAALADSGLFLIGASPEMGGFDATLDDVWAALESLALGDPSIAWIVVNTGVSGIIASRMGPDAREALLGAGAGPVGNAATFVGKAVATEDGYVLSGEWPFCTGAEHARMFMCGSVVYDGDVGRVVGGVPETRAFVVPPEAVEVIRTWDGASALRGTGSHAIRVKACPVTAARSWSPLDPLVIDWPLYRIPRFPVFVGSAGVIALACLRSALDGTIAANAAKVSNADGGAHADRPTIQQAVAQADAAWRAARAALSGVAEETWADARDLGVVSDPVKARLYSTIFHALDTACSTISRLYAVSSSATYATRNPVERALREAHAFAAALESFRAVEFSAGRVLLGHGPSTPMF